MTNPVVDAVAVTQADREAAAALSEAIVGRSTGRDQIAECRAGRQDDTHLVQAFARHRQSADAALVEALEAPRLDGVADVLTGIEVARRRIAPLMKQGEDYIWRPAQFAYEVLGNAALALTRGERT